MPSSKKKRSKKKKKKKIGPFDADEIEWVKKKPRIYSETNLLIVLRQPEELRRVPDVYINIMQKAAQDLVNAK